MNETETEKLIRDSCLKLLARREHSQLEILQKVVSKGYEQEQVKQVVEDLAAQGWQSDARFCESYARYRIKKGVGPIKIGQELHQRGIETFDLDSILLDLADSWTEILTQVYKKKYADDKWLSKNEWFNRSRFLQQRGFSGEMINTLFKQLSIQINYSK